MKRGTSRKERLPVFQAVFEGFRQNLEGGLRKSEPSHIENDIVPGPLLGLQGLDELVKNINRFRIGIFVLLSRIYIGQEYRNLWHYKACTD